MDESQVEKGQASPTTEGQPAAAEPAQRGNERQPSRGPGGGGPGGGNRQGQNQRGDREQRGDRPREGPRHEGRPDDRRGDRDRYGDRGREGPAEIDLDKLIADSLYLDNQAHAIVGRMRDMDSATKSQLRRLYNAVRRACRAATSEKQHEFVMLRARLAYTIARHSLRSLDGLERLLLQVTRKNDQRGYERFRDLFEAIVAYNE